MEINSLVLTKLRFKNSKIETLYYQINKISPPKVHFYGIFNNWLEIFRTLRTQWSSSPPPPTLQIMSMPMHNNYYT